MWSSVGSKKHPRWLWAALDHHTGRVVAYIFGRRTDRAFLKVKGLLEPLGIRHFYTDGWGAYRRRLDHAAMWWVNGGPNSWSGNISPYKRGSNG